MGLSVEVAVPLRLVFLRGIIAFVLEADEKVVGLLARWAGLRAAAGSLEPTSVLIVGASLCSPEAVLQLESPVLERLAELV